MHWQELTWPRFGQAVKDVGGVCVLPVGAVLGHGGHLPLGTDSLAVDFIAAQAAEKEPAIVFPPYYFGWVTQAKHRRGTIALSHRMMLKVLDNTVQQIARNGLKKIILLNGHWASASFLQDFTAATLHRARDYAVYLMHMHQFSPAQDPGWQKMRASAGWSFGGEEQTSLMLAVYSHLVRMGEISGEGKSRKKTEYLAGIQISAQIPADHPDLYAGDARPATAEKGKYVLDYAVEQVAKAIAAVKGDTQVRRWLAKYYQAMAHPTGEV